MSIVRPAALALAMLVGFVVPAIRASDAPAPVAGQAGTKALDVLITQLSSGSLSLTDDTGRVVATRSHDGAPAHHLAERAVAAAISTAPPDVAKIARIWELLADADTSAFATLPVVMALAGVSTHPQSREALWSELAALSHTAGSQRRTNAGSLLTVFETHREALLPLLPPVRETEGAGDEMASLMAQSHVFGGDIWESVFDMVKRNPAAVARFIERQRERGRPVKWEYQGFEGLMQWRDTHFIAALHQPPHSPDALDAAGETFISIFNSLHTLNDWFRVQMLKGLGPAELFNAAVSGEQQLYRLGTSGYRDFLHPVILAGIQESGTFEAFLMRATPASRSTPPGTREKRGLIFLRIAASFGLLDSVLVTVRDRDAFVTGAIAALGDPRSFESSSAIVADILTGRSGSPQTASFKRALLDKLYLLYGSESNGARRIVYGSMLSAYQTVTNDRRDSRIDRDFPLDRSMLHLAFDRMFKRAPSGPLVHRMFMRMHDDLDAARTFNSIRTLMTSLGASAREARHHTVFRITAPGRAIEIYVNDPTAAGTRQGIADIADALRATGAETVVGRGHTGIIRPLQSDARRVLGDAVRNVAAVIVGTCGSDASVRGMIDTFGYVPFVTTKSSGHQSINNEILRAYIVALLALQPGQTLSMAATLDHALSRFLKERANEELREDAKLYQVNVATALAAQLFDTHVRRYTETLQSVAR